MVAIDLSINFCFVFHCFPVSTKISKRAPCGILAADEVASSTSFVIITALFFHSSARTISPTRGAPRACAGEFALVPITTTLLSCSSNKRPAGACKVIRSFSGNGSLCPGRAMIGASSWRRSASSSEVATAVFVTRRDCARRKAVFTSRRCAESCMSIFPNSRHRSLAGARRLCIAAKAASSLLSSAVDPSLKPSHLSRR
mmetsp:Transcript_16036/g.24056  ORF Transcript_16036/g.24056 Transcript_16036/m.24056 type:complete len:200 (+) Transcript_16036:830-1429(+)